MPEISVEGKVSEEVVDTKTYSNSGYMYNYEVHKKPERFIDYYFSLPITSAFVELMNGMDHPAVLDLGSGRGVESAKLRESIPSARVISLDISTVGTRFAKKEFGLKLIQADINNLPIAEASFDGIHCKDVLVHIPDKNQFIKDVCRALKPGGYFILDSSIVTYPNFVQYAWDPDEFITIADECGLELIMREQVEMGIDEWYGIKQPRAFMLFKRVFS